MDGIKWGDGGGEREGERQLLNSVWQSWESCS